MRCPAALVAAWVLVGALLVAPGALAQHVVLVRPQAPDRVLTEAFNRLRAELELQGFDTSVIDLETRDTTPSALAELAQRERAFAGISLSRRVGASSADISIVDRVTGKTSIRTLALGNEPEAPTLLAVRAADLLRASLREFEADEKPPREVVGVDVGPRPPGVEDWAREDPSFRLDARALVLGVTQADGRALAPSVGLSYRLTDRFALGLIAAGPTLPSSIRTRFGNAVLHRALGLARFSVTAYRQGHFALRPGALAGVHYLDARGEVAPPLVAEKAQVLSFAGGLELEADYHLTEAFVVGASVSGLMLDPRPVVAVLEEQVRVAHPVVAASAGVGVEF